MKRPATSFLILCTLSIIGLSDSIYLTADSFEKVPPYCPTVGVIDCAKVTLSQYSHPFGIPVAPLGLLWFAGMLLLGSSGKPFAQYIMLPLWLVGIIMVGYLVYVELFLLGAICLYCTLAHVCTALIGIPVFKLTFSDEQS